MKSRHCCACNTQLAQRQFESAILELQPEYFEFSGESDEEVIDWLKDLFGSNKPAMAQSGAAAAVAAKARRVADKAKAGIQAEKVCWIQTVLNKAGGEKLVADGVYGPLTREATRRFQSRNGLTVDGIVGPRTETALIQAALNQIARASILPVNGVMDAKTRQEIQRFQARNNLAQDGVVGPKTRAAMVVALGGRCIVRSSRPSGQQGSTFTSNGPKPIGCDLRKLESLTSQCRNNAIQAGINCLRQFGLGVSEAAGILTPLVELAVATSEIPGIDLITAAIAGIAAAVLATEEIVEAAGCVQSALMNLVSCQEKARQLSGC
jgi:peptidoglycan hydrolase-like protein with peptidoglycan-binding domain